MLWNRKIDWFSSQLDNNISLMQSGDYSSIPWIFCVFAENHMPSKTVAAKALCAVLGSLTFDELILIDRQMRQTTSIEWGINWRNYSINSFFTPDMDEDERRAVIVFASFNPNGFIREQAMRMMKDCAGTLPFVILRQNDWVLQVRNAAEKIAEHRLSHLSPGELIAALPFVDILSRSKRVSRKSIYTDIIHSTLTSHENESDLAAGLDAANIRSRRICTNALFNMKSPRYDLAFSRLKKETDPFLRAFIFSQLVGAGQNMDSVIESFLQDKYPHNRIKAFQYICEHDQNRALQISHDLLLDKNAAVRDTVRFFLKSECADFDFDTFYKKHLTTHTVPAIYGLSETGNTEYMAVIEGYLHVTQTSVVRAAMTAIMRLSCNKYDAAITEFLMDDRVGIVKAARNLILKTASPNYARVMEIFKATPYENTKRKCFSILLTASKWPRLIFILDILENGGEGITDYAIAALERWIDIYNRSYAVASKAQTELIFDNIKRLGDTLPESLRNKLLFLLR